MPIEIAGVSDGADLPSQKLEVFGRDENGTSVFSIDTQGWPLGLKTSTTVDVTFTKYRILMNTYSTNVSTKTPRKYRRTQKNVPRLTTNDRWKSRCPTDGFMPQGCTTTPTPPFVCQLP